MNGLTAGWKIFKAICIIQLVLVALELMFSIAALFYGKNMFVRLIETVCYSVMLIFLYQGFSVLNDNYPDTALSTPQKKKFNLLFLFNFLFIAILFGQVVSLWRSTIPMLKIISTDMSGYIMLSLGLIFAILIFIFHLVFLLGMYKLRRIIYINSTKTFEKEFGD